MARKHKDVDWQLPVTENGALKSWDYIQIAVLMDIRDELKKLNETLGCYRVQRMSDDIHRIDRRLQKHMPLGKGRHA
jgi:hypothetical protein